MRNHSTIDLRADWVKSRHHLDLHVRHYVGQVRHNLLPDLAVERYGSPTG